MFTRVAIVNRGEPAMRLIRAVRELNEQHRHGIRVIALHTEAERRALFVRAADESVCLREVSTSGGPYLDHAELERALRASRADAVWVGWGFVAEDPDFAELCERLGLVFIGPPPEAMRRLGDKIEAKLLAEQIGVPVAPWSGGPVRTAEEAAEHADRIGYPVLIKARAGGGGRGIRVVHSADDLGRCAGANSGRGPPDVRQRGCVPRTTRRRRSPHRGAGHRRQPRHRVGTGSPRLLDPAAQPEAGRGVQLTRADTRAGARAPNGSHRPRPGCGLPRGRNRRVSLPAGRQDLRLLGGEHPVAGRAPGHRGHHRARLGQAAAARR